MSLSREQEFGYKTQELAAWEIFPVTQCTYLFSVPRNPLALFLTPAKSPWRICACMYRRRRIVELLAIRLRIPYDFFFSGVLREAPLLNLDPQQPLAKHEPQFIQATDK